MVFRVISNKILPEQIDDNFSGHIIALYMFIFLTILTIARSLTHMFLPDGGAGSIASIDISVQGGTNIVSIFYLWGLSQLIIGILYLIVLCRYKSLIPLMYILFLFEYLGRFLVSFYKPLETLATPPGEIGNIVFVPLAIVLLYLSLRE